MKKTILTIALLSLNFSIFAQTDSTKIEDSVKTETTEKIFQYRIKMENVTNSFSSETVKLDLRDIFLTEPIFHEPISEFVFTSSEDIEYNRVHNTFSGTSYKLVSFRKTELLK